MSKSAPRIILTTGGTGGHVFPALAVAEQLRREGAELLFVGSQYGSEAKLAKQAGLEFRGLPVRGVLGRIATSISQSGANIEHVSMDPDSSGFYSELHFLVEVSGRMHLANLIRGLRRIPDVIRIAREQG